MRKLLLIPAILLLTACNEEDVLYKTQSREEIPPVNTGVQMAAHGAMEAPSAPGGLPPPMVVDFDLKEPARSMIAHTIEGVVIPIPEGYDEGEAPSDMRAAEFFVPNAEGERGELVVFHFGADQGGGMMANAARWAGQFEPPAGEQSPVLGFFADPDVNGLRVSRLLLGGTWSGGMAGGSMEASGPAEDWGMDAIIIEGGPNGSLFVRLTGPIDLVERESEAMRFLASNVAPAARLAADPRETVSPGELALVQAPGVQFAIPADWRRVEPESSMRSLQFAIPAEEGAEAEFVLFYFGPEGGGSVDENLERWASQMKQPDGSSPLDRATIERTEINGLKLASVYAEGTYAPIAMGPMAPVPAPIEDHALMGIIISDGEKGPLYIRITGPKETMNIVHDDLAIMLGSIAPAEEE